MSLVYRPLRVAYSEIRLLTLLRADNFSEPIRCTLHNISLDLRPKFEALSYCWGQPEIREQIQLDEHCIEVTVNLESALRYLRQRRHDRVLWIDALCINQHDILEKNSQIPMMGRIYRSARTILAWFGPANHAVESALDRIEAYCSPKWQIASLSQRTTTTIRGGPEPRQLTSGYIIDTLTGFREIFLHPY